jgi:NADPH:quinone reductase-like Zn-dependent oxidoreductase
MQQLILTRSGLHVITTCSPKNFDLVRSRGADRVFDYNDPSCGQKIREATDDQLCHVLDCISTEQTMELSAAALSSDSSLSLRYVGLMIFKEFPRQDVDAKWTFAYTVLGEAFSKIGMDFPAKPEDYEHTKMFWKLSHPLLVEGKIKPHPVEIRSGGLEGMIEG